MHSNTQQYGDEIQAKATNVYQVPDTHKDFVSSRGSCMKTIKFLPYRAYCRGEGRR